MPRRAPVSDAELEVLKVLWEAGPSTVREVAGVLGKQRRRLAYNTVLTLLSRLREKGYVASDRRDAAHLFRPLVSREELVGSSLAALADRLCDGTASPLLHALVRGQRLSAEEIARFRELLNQLENAGSDRLRQGFGESAGASAKAEDPASTDLASTD